MEPDQAVGRGREWGGAVLAACCYNVAGMRCIIHVGAVWHCRVAADCHLSRSRDRVVVSNHTLLTPLRFDPPIRHRAAMFGGDEYHSHMAR